uniref:HORMA domain-containing protein n=1 Tax=Panagrolaimus davidi TaxID=227884 RepID=A0A914Q5X5_9BILA
MAASVNKDPWIQTFPQHPDDNPSAFFLRLTILAISNYCHGRKILPPQCFKKRIIESHELYTFEKEVEGGGKELMSAILQLKHVFTTKTVSTVIFMVCGTSVDDPIESLYFNFSFDPVLQPT